MKRLLAILAVGVAVTMLGCGKGKNPAPNSGSGDPSTQGSTAGKSLPPPPPNVAAHTQNAPAENVAGQVDPFLTQQLQIFIQQKGRVPQSFAELASARLDSVPNPPLGKKWVIDSATRQVKAVAAQ